MTVCIPTVPYCVVVTGNSLYSLRWTFITAVLLPQMMECWDYMCEAPSLAQKYVLVWPGLGSYEQNWGTLGVRVPFQGHFCRPYRTVSPNFHHGGFMVLPWCWYRDNTPPALDVELNVSATSSLHVIFLCVHSCPSPPQMPLSPTNAYSWLWCGISCL